MHRTSFNLFVPFAGFSLWCAAALMGCADEAPGTLQVSVSGQSFALTGWPVDVDGETVALADGWTVRFKAVVVSLSRFSLGDRDGELSGLDAGPVLVDLHRLSATTLEETLWTFADVPAQRFDQVGYHLNAADPEARIIGEVDAKVVAAMVEAGASLYLAGYGDRDGDPDTEDDHYEFEWLIDGEVENTRCLNGADKTYGVVVEENQVTEAELTFHLDHLLWDNHDADEPHLLFEAYAAASALAAAAQDQEDDHVITLDDLVHQDLTDLRGLDGEELKLDGKRVVYRARAGAQLPKDTLHDYLIDAALSTGHFNGEGHCEYSVEHR